MTIQLNYSQHKYPPLLFSLGVPILMSQNIYELMSDEGKEHCRRVDKVRGTFLGNNLNLFFNFISCLSSFLPSFLSFQKFPFFFLLTIIPLYSILSSLLFSNSLLSVLHLFTSILLTSLSHLIYISFPSYVHMYTSKYVVHIYTSKYFVYMYTS